MKLLSVVAAVANNMVIGDGARIPWHIPDDLRMFKSLTLGKPVVMGRRTHQSIGRVLPERVNVVLSRDRDYWPLVGSFKAYSLDSALEMMEDHEEVFVVGGAALYAEALPVCDRLYLTRVDADPPGDVHFPPFDEGDFELVSSSPKHKPRGDVPGWRFDIMYRRVTYRDRLASR